MVWNTWQVLKWAVRSSTSDTKQVGAYENLMTMIKVVSQSTTAYGWQFEVAVGDGDSASMFQVDVDTSYCVMLTGSSDAPQDLVKRSFEFLLAREPKESILSSFNLKVIQKYFPEYEKEIQKK
jgi:hypothetical protein